MVYACPPECDPREKLPQFISDPEFRTIAGLRTEGLGALIDMVEAEIGRQAPDSRTIRLDREVLSDNGIDFARDLESYFDRMTADGRRVDFLMNDDMPVINWQSALKILTGRNAQVFCFSVACRQVPCCSKLV